MTPYYKKLVAGAILTTMAAGLVNVVAGVYQDVQGLKTETRLINQKQETTDNYLKEMSSDIRTIREFLLQAPKRR